MQTETTPVGSILVVEDEAVLRNALVCLLKYSGYEAVGVGTVAEGLACLNGQAFVILELVSYPDGSCGITRDGKADPTLMWTPCEMEQCTLALLRLLRAR